MAKYSRPEREQERKYPPATTPEGEEKQLVSIAMDLAKKRMLAGTASAQEVVHFLKLGSSSAKVERTILEKQSELLTAKTESIRAAKRVDELYAEAIAAMRTYAGDMSRDEDED